MAMIGKFSASSAYATIYMYSTELFPTSVRNSCMGSCSMMARFGSMSAPFVNTLVSK
jgi:MFS transporter, OCT family, solute carrier family 22 (organic cation transporter), member 4/5